MVVSPLTVENHRTRTRAILKRVGSAALATCRGDASVPERDRQFRLVRVHHEHCEEFGRLCLAGIGTDTVAVAGQLREALSSLVGRHWSVVDLAADGSLEHGRVDEGGSGMRVAWRIAARAIFDEH